MRNYEQMEQIFFNRAVEYGIFTRDEDKEESITNEELCRIFYLTAQKLNVQLDDLDSETCTDTSIFGKLINLKIINGPTDWNSSREEKANFSLLNDLESAFYEIEKLDSSSLELWNSLTAIYGPAFFPTNYLVISKGMVAVAGVNWIDKHVTHTINEFERSYRTKNYERSIKYLVNYITPYIYNNNINVKYMDLAYALRRKACRSNTDEITRKDLLLLRVYMGVQDIFEEYFGYNPSRKDGIPSRIYHYTSLQTLEKLSGGSPIRLSNTLNLNDPSEGKLLPQYLDKINYDLAAAGISEDFSLPITDYFVISFCSDSNDSLPMWQLYAGGSTGCRIGFKLDQFANYTICRVIYNKDIIKAFMDDIVRFRNAFIKADLEVLNLLDATIINKLTQVAFLFKDKAYEYENEVRLLYETSPQTAKEGEIVEGEIFPRLYAELPMNVFFDYVQLGPKVSDYLASHISLGIEARIKDCTIVRSSIKIR